MIAIAEKIIEQQEGPFDPGQFIDRYEEALKALIEDKKKGHKPAKVAEPDDTNVIDLMAALRASLNAKAKGAAKPAAKAKAPAKAKARKAG
jgi:DNA end-binding protein Ku